jgi:hypothetical protein
MVFVDNLVDKLVGQISSIYGTLLEKNHLRKTGNVLNCSSFIKLAMEITYIRDKRLEQKFTILNITNEIIHTILIKSYFKHFNNEMAMYVGYAFLTMHGEKGKKFSLGGITNDSTIEEIRVVTSSW